MRNLWSIVLLLVVASAHGERAPAQSVAEAPPSGRLPAGVRPVAYRLDLLLDPRRDEFSGSVEIDVELDVDSRRVWLHGEGLRVTRAAAETAAGASLPGDYTEVATFGVAMLEFEDTLPAGPVTLRLDYRAAFNRNLAGLFKVEEQGEAYVLAKSESIQARKFLPGFDEPGLKATYDISLTIPAGYVAIGNTPQVARHPAGEGLERVVFATTRPMPTYLLSLAVGPFDTVTRAPIPPNEFRERPIPLRGYTRKGRGNDMNFVLDVTPRLLEIFERELRQPYPFAKLDIVAAPQWPSGATELSAAITYREQRILVGDDPAPGARLSLLGVHAHELAHMWFGNLVTPPWWEDLWLKEGFATWGETLALTRFEPEGGHDLDAAADAIRAMRLDSLASTRAIREPILDNKNIRNAYDAITYAKSLGVIHMIDQYFGEDRFRPALGRYIETFADGVADSAAFYRVIGEQTDTPALTDAFRSFVEQKGVPLLDVELNCSDDAAPEISLRQSRYRPLGSPIDGDAGNWSIPVCLQVEGTADNCFIMSGRRHTVRLDSGRCPQWVLPNARGSGYYRWNLDEAHWQSLMRAFGSFSPVEQLFILDSAFAAFEAGILSQQIILPFFELAASAEQRQIITAPLLHLDKVQRHYMQAPERPGYRQYVQGLYQPVLERTRDSVDPDQQLLHSDLTSFMALSARDPQVRRQLRDKVYLFTGFDGERIPGALQSDLFNSALAVAVQDSDATFLTHLLAVRKEIDDPLFENASAYAIGYNNDPAQAERIHELLLSGELGARETYGLMLAAISESELSQQHWQWLRENFDAVIANVPEQWRRRTPRFAGDFCDIVKIGELRELFVRNKQLVPGHKRSLAQTVETIELCVALRERGEALVDAILAR